MPPEWDSLTAHQEADGGWYVGDTGSFPAIRDDDPKPARRLPPWWWPLALLILACILLAAAILLAPDAGGVPIPFRPDSACRCGTRTPI